jgi:hypothetical protein
MLLIGALLLVAGIWMFFSPEVHGALVAASVSAGVVSGGGRASFAASRQGGARSAANELGARVLWRRSTADVTPV